MIKLMISINIILEKLQASVLLQVKNVTKKSVYIIIIIYILNQKHHQQQQQQLLKKTKNCVLGSKLQDRAGMPWGEGGPSLDLMWSVDSTHARKSSTNIVHTYTQLAS